MTIAQMKANRKNADEWFLSLLAGMEKKVVSPQQMQVLTDAYYGFMAFYDAEICYAENMNRRIAEINEFKAGKL